jgi:enoyl-CoA hydratase
VTTAADFENILFETRGAAAWITLNRPDKLNALNRRTVEEITSAVDRAVADSAVCAIVITGSGEKAFAAGADIGEMAELDPAAAQEYSRFLQTSLDAIERSRKPVIAVINGFALGGGCELAAACHIRLAGRRARLGQPEVNLGLIPGAGGTQRLQRLVGRGRALDLVLTGEMIDADRAVQIGLVDRVFPDEELIAAAAGYVETLRKKSPIAMTRALEAIVVGAEIPQAEAMRFEAALFSLCFATEDMREGTRAFLEKRKPVFKGR